MIRSCIDEKLEEYIKKFANPYTAASRGFIDDVIEPAQITNQVDKRFSAFKDQKR